MTVNHGVLGSSPCSGAIARGLQERCRSGVDSTSVERNKSCSPKPFFGSLAQLVQSICLTSRGSAVRIRQLPRAKWNRRQSHSIEWLLLYICDLGVYSQRRRCTTNQSYEVRLCLRFYFRGDRRIAAQIITLDDNLRRNPQQSTPCTPLRTKKTRRTSARYYSNSTIYSTSSRG